MDKISNKIALLREKVKKATIRMDELKKANKKLEEINEGLVTKMAIIEEENKWAGKFIKERDIIKSRIKNIMENIERAKV
ncbi:MAG: hypothetical protein JW983_03620 [Elusimicrobia bacterium]|nr:hypothetical protein [Elusimicrobiota bacterium]